MYVPFVDDFAQVQRRFFRMRAADSPVDSALAKYFFLHGYASIGALSPPADIAVIQSLLDPLYDRFETLGDRAVDLTGPRVKGIAPRSAEINEAAVLEPRLRQTATFQRCRSIARMLLGVPVGYQFDHAIYKPPGNNAPTHWHQDEAYNEKPLPLRSIHFWIPLQAVNVANGCMQFIPGSHLGPKLRHDVIRRGTLGTTQIARGVDGSRAVPCPLPLGGATIHHPLTLHYTGANESNSYRRAWIVHFGAYGKWRHRLHPKTSAAKLSGWTKHKSND